MDVWQAAHRALGPFRAPDHHAEIRCGRVSDHLVVGCREGGQARAAAVSAEHRPGSSHIRLSRRQTLILGAGALGAAVGAPVRSVANAGGTDEAVERHGLSAFGDLKYPPDFRHFDYVDSNAPK